MRNLRRYGADQDLNAQVTMTGSLKEAVESSILFNVEDGVLLEWLGPNGC